MYEIKEFIENYTIKELTDGGVLALSEAVPLSVSDYKENNGERITVITADFPAGEEDWDIKHVNTRVQLDNTNGELVATGCKCAYFRKDGYACKHVVALQMTWLMKAYGENAFKASPINDMLKQATGYDDPFIPGILKKTSRSLSNILKSVNLPDPGVYNNKNSSEVIPGSLKLEVHVYNEKLKLFEFKAGMKKTYVVKDVRVFLAAFKNHDKIDFGKSLSFNAYEEYMNEDSRKILRLLLEYYAMASEDQNTHYFYGSSGNNARYIKIVGRYYDELMELLSGKTFFSVTGQPLTFTTEEYRPDIKIDKMTFGASVRMDAVSKMTETGNWIYIRNGEIVFRISKAGGSKLSSFISLFEKQDELYVSEQDLPILCRDVLTDFTEAVNISCSGMELGFYLPEKPVIKLYLDYPNEGLISLKPEAVYSNINYPLCLEYIQKQNRDIRYEKMVLDKLRPFFQAYDEKTESYYFQGNEEDLYYFLTDGITQLEKIGELYISDRLKKLKVRPVKRFSVGVSVDGGLLNLNVNTEEFSRDELIELLCAYDRKKKYYRLKNGSIFKIDDEQTEIFEALYECIRGLRKPSDGEWKIPLFRALYLDEMLRDRDCVTVEKNNEYRRLISNMRDHKDNPSMPPESIKDILRGYQTDGFRWISMLKENGFGGILADDMGLGKTLQVLAFLLSEKESGKGIEDLRTLIITPASLVYNWKKEIERYTPSLKIAMITGTANERKNQILSGASDAEVWITSYDLLKRDIGFYENISFANEILDEAQFIKNQTTNASKSVRLVNSSFRMALTGTPIENRLSELWSIFDYLMPGFLHSYARFRDEFEIPVVTTRDEAVLKRLHSLVHPFILRRLKGDVLKELPDKLEEEISVSITGEQRKLYDAHARRLKMFLEKQSKEEFAQGKLEILAELTKLRQLCCHPGMIFEDYNAPNAKMDACMELIRQAVDGGHKILLFSQFTTMLDALGEKLRTENIAYHRIDGSVKKEDRIRLVDSFAGDDVPVFCISLKAGGTGLNLTAADIVIHFDPWWNVAAMNQATDRTHRIGQTNVVTVYQLIAADTIEEKIVGLQKSKHRLAEDVLSGEGIGSILIDREQVLSLFG